jgi:8-oxo-dGTP diphosphatase
LAQSIFGKDCRTEGKIDTLLATLGYLKKDGRTLMVLRNRKPHDIHAGKWNGLGGKFEPGESPEECFIREVREESGLKVVKPRLHGLVMFPGFKGSNWYVFIFSAAEFSGELIDSPEGDLRWVPDDELEALNLWPSDHYFFGWMREGKFFSAKFIYEGDEMKGYEVNFYPT